MKVHLSLPTTDLARSVAFYKTLLNTEPLKRNDDYALFVAENPGIELALNPQDRVHTDSGAHFGIAAEKPEAVDAATERLTRAGLVADVENDETCCYARQNKVWTTDPDGRRWEVYYVLEETKERDGADAQCCSEETCDDYATCCAG